MQEQNETFQVPERHQENGGHLEVMSRELNPDQLSAMRSPEEMRALADATNALMSREPLVEPRAESAPRQETISVIQAAQATAAVVAMRERYQQENWTLAA